MVWFELAGLLILVVLVVVWAVGMLLVVFEAVTAPLLDSKQHRVIADPYHRMRDSRS